MEAGNVAQCRTLSNIYSTHGCFLKWHECCHEGWRGSELQHVVYYSYISVGGRDIHRTYDRPENMSTRTRTFPDITDPSRYQPYDKRE